MIAPIFFGLLTILAIAGYAVVFLWLPIPFFFKILIGAGVAALAGAMIYVLIQRTREMEEEDKDDLGKY